MHWPLGSQQPAHVEGPHATQPLAWSGLFKRQNFAASHGPWHTEPQPSESPHAFPSQSGVHASHMPYAWAEQRLPCWVQSTQAAPWVPHCVSVSAATHPPIALQQPSAQFAMLHGPEPPPPPPPPPHAAPHHDFASDVHAPSQAL